MGSHSLNEPLPYNTAEAQKNLYSMKMWHLHGPALFSFFFVSLLPGRQQTLPPIVENRHYSLSYSRVYSKKKISLLNVDFLGKFFFI